VRLIFGISLVAALALVVPAAQANVRFAAPGAAIDAPCTEVAPCHIRTAIEGTGVAAGDEVVLASGTYDADVGAITGLSALVDEVGVHIHTQVGAAPARLRFSDPDAGLVLAAVASVLEDVDISQSSPGNALVLATGATARRTRVSGGSGAPPCTLLGGTTEHATTLENAVCSSNHVAEALAVLGDPTEGPVVAAVEHVTAVAPESGAAAMFIGSSAGGSADVRIRDSILASGGDDLVLEQDTEPLTVVAERSNFDAPQMAGTPTFVDGGGNQAEEPVFASSMSDLSASMAESSPTLDAGSVTETSSFDLRRHRRFAGLAEDMGATELIPAPTVGSLSVDSITDTSAVARLVLDTHHTTTRVTFTLGVDRATPIAIFEQDLAVINGEQVVTQALSGLSPGASYVVQARADSDGGVVRAPNSVPFATLFTDPGWGPYVAPYPPAPMSPPQGPRITRFSVTPAVRRGGRVAIRFVTDARTTVAIVFERRLLDRRGRRRYVEIRRSLRTAPSGPVRVILSTRRVGRLLPAGTYRVTVASASSDGASAVGVRRRLVHITRRCPGSGGFARLTGALDAARRRANPQATPEGRG